MTDRPAVRPDPADGPDPDELDEEALEAEALLTTRPAEPDPAPPPPRWRNWGRTESVIPAAVAEPADAQEVSELVHRALDRGGRVKAVGAGHSFTGIAVATDVQVRTERLSGLRSVDLDAGLVTVGAGTRLFELPALLRPYGLAMANLGDIDRQSIAGAVSTGTHGTGSRFGGLATQVAGLRMIIGTGEAMTISADRNPELLGAAALGLGALGILTEVTLQCVPAFNLAATERPEPLGDVLDGFAERCDSADHFEFYWFPHTCTALTKTNTRLPGDVPTAPLNPVRRFVDDTVVGNWLFRALCAAEIGVPRLTPAINRFAERLTGRRAFTDRSAEVFTTRRTVRFRELEYGLPRAAVPPAVREIAALIDRRGWRISFPIEVRSAAADDLWLSTAYGRLTGYIAVHRYLRDRAVEPYFHEVEAILRDHGGRPHWGKLHTQGADTLRLLYPRFDDFIAVRNRLDPHRVFGNDYLDRVLGS